MSVYDRQESLPNTISNASKNLEELKSQQNISNENIVAYLRQESSETITLSEGQSCVIKGTYILDKESDAMVQLAANLVLWSSSGTIYYSEYVYLDPTTITDKTKKSIIFAFNYSSGDGDIVISAHFASICGVSGSITVERIS